MDNISPERRSEIMSRVQSLNTKPEMIVRKLVYSLGYRYRIHPKDVPGKPDLVFKGRKKVIFVHGCFWHRHEGCLNTRTPKSRVGFWEEKFRKNQERDRAHYKKLSQAGWKYLIIWECQVKNTENLEQQVFQFLEELK